MSNKLLEFIASFKDTKRAITALTLATYGAANAIFNAASNIDLLISTATLSSPDLDLQKPTMSVAAMIVITSLLLVQVAGITLLAVYASRYPSWTE